MQNGFGNTNHLRFYWWWMLLLPLPAYWAGMFIDIMDIDAAQYAAIAWEMLESGSFLQLTYKGSDYLDKPPLLFWTAAFSFQYLGIANWTYRLVPLLVALFGIYALYRLARLYYNQTVAYVAALIWMSCQACFLMNHDIRTDTMLTAWVTFAIWQCAAYLKQGGRLYLLGAGLGIGLAMLAKGPIGLMAPALAIGFDMAVKRQWHKFLQPAWLLVLFVVALMLLPMSVGLYQQFDAHPEKGISGLRFYYWTQSFGRITGESPWRNDAGVFFFVHSFYWSFLPWCLLATVAYILQTRQLWRSGLRSGFRHEYISWGGFTLVFIAFSLSKFKLPHYTFVVFPLMALLTAKWVVVLIKRAKPSWVRKLRHLQRFVEGVLWLLLLLMLLWIFPLTDFWGWMGLLLLLVAYTWLLFRKEAADKHLILPSLFTISVVNLFLNAHLYPALLTYQAPVYVGRYLMQHPEVRQNTFAYLDYYHPSLIFYSQSIVADLRDSIKRQLPNPVKEHDQELLEAALAKTFWQNFLAQRADQPTYFYIDEKYIGWLEEAGLHYHILLAKERFPVTELTIPFLLPEQRPYQVSKQYLLRVAQ